MDSCNGPDIPSITPEEPVSTPAVHVGICAEVSSPALPAGHSSQPGNHVSPSPAGTFEFSRGSAGVGDEIDAMPPTPSLIHFVLGNFAFAMFLIFLLIFIVFFVVTWLTVLRDARLVRDQVHSNVTGVSISCFNGCALLTVVVTVDINNRPRPPTGPQCIRVIQFMDGPRLRSAHHLWGSILVLCSHPRGLQTIR